MKKRYFGTVVIIAVSILTTLVVNFVLHKSSKSMLDESEKEPVTELTSSVEDTMDIQQRDDGESTDIIIRFSQYYNTNTITIDGTEYSLTTTNFNIKKNGVTYKELSEPVKSGKVAYGIIVNIPHEDGAEYVVEVDLEYTAKDDTQKYHLHKEFIPQKQ